MFDIDRVFMNFTEWHSYEYQNLLAILDKVL
jgi:hypothetical protein